MSGRGQYRAKASSLAARIIKQNLNFSRNGLRDFIDQHTYGELDTTQMDIVCEMVESRVASAQKETRPQ